MYTEALKLPDLPIKSELAHSSIEQHQQEEFEKSLNKHFIKGWKGEGLLSKSSLKIQQLLDSITEDVARNFRRRFGQFNRSLKVQLFEEFSESFSSNGELDPIVDYVDFGRKILSETSDYEEDINQYVQSYSFKVAVIYLLKFRLICKIKRSALIDLEDYDLLNPNNLLNRVFARGSRSEIYCECLESNHYTSWYRINTSLLSEIKKLPEHLDEISLVEFAKVIEGVLTNSRATSYRYSHSLSHKTFGKLLNMLLIYYPSWSSYKSDTPPPFDYSKYIRKSESPLAPLITKYIGNYIPSLALSHWLAQESNEKKSWKALICPEFQLDKKSYDGDFLKITHELQFLYSLIDISGEISFDPIKMITSVNQSKFDRQFNGKEAQISLFESFVEDKIYDRVVLNATQLPQTNSHYHLVSKLLKEKDSLREGGFLILMANQNLFVPSQAERVRQIQKFFQIETCINFEAIEGKGEVSNFIYILKRWTSHQDSFDGSIELMHNSQALYNFRLRGSLLSFHAFDTIYKQMNSIFCHPQKSSGPIFSKELGANITIDFFQDAVRDGQLIKSVSEDTSQITHPQFFKKLISASTRLSNYFGVHPLSGETLSPKFKKDGYKCPNKDQFNLFQLVLVVDFRDTTDVSLEIIPARNLLAKKEEYGLALCHYFGLTLKIPGLNINLFREYFEHRIGKQVIQKTFLNQPTKIRSHVENLLVPKFFEKIRSLNASSKKLFSEWDSLKPDDFKNQDSYIRKALGDNQLFQEYPKEIAIRLSKIKQTLKHQIHGDHERKTSSLFERNEVVSQLVKAACTPIYPDNDELHLKFYIKESRELDNVIKSTKVQKISIKSKELYKLVISSHDSPEALCEIFSDKIVCEFLEFLLSKMSGITLRNFLMGTNIPSHKELRSITENLKERDLTLNSLSNLLEERIEEIFFQQLQ